MRPLVAAVALLFLAACVGPPPCIADDTGCTNSSEYQTWDADKKAENRAILRAGVQGVIIGVFTLGAGAIVGAALPPVPIP